MVVVAEVLCRPGVQLLVTVLERDYGFWESFEAGLRVSNHNGGRSTWRCPGKLSVGSRSCKLEEHC